MIASLTSVMRWLILLFFPVAFLGSLLILILVHVGILRLYDLSNLAFHSQQTFSLSVPSREHVAQLKDGPCGHPGVCGLFWGPWVSMGECS